MLSAGRSSPQQITTKWIGSSACTCLLQCSFREACVHSFDCTCIDYSVRNVVCTHIHAVRIAEPADAPRELNADDHIDSNVEKDLQNSNDLEDVKRRAMAEIAELSDILQSAPSKDTIHSALRHIRAPTESVDWVECGKCQVWVHTFCDYVADDSNYICCMCSPWA